MNIIVRNPATGQVLKTSEKIFDSIYRDKGFEVVTRDNAEKGVASSGKKPKDNGPISVVSSAADMASRLGLEDAADKDPEPTTATNADAESDVAAGGDAESGGIETGDTDKAKDPESKTNEVNVDTDGDAVSDAREPAKRDRGRGSK